MKKKYLLLVLLLTVVSAVNAQRIEPFLWKSVTPLELLPETKIIHGGVTSDRTILIRDVPLGLWQKNGNALTPIQPNLPEGEVLHQVWVVENQLYFISLEKKQEDDAIVYLYKSDSGPETAVKVFSTALKGGIFSLPFKNDDPYGWNFYLQPTDAPGILIFITEYKERPFPGCGTLVQKVTAYCSLNNGEQWDFLDEYNNITSPYLYNYSNGYFISIYENSDNELRLSDGFPIDQNIVVKKKSPYNYHWKSFIIRDNTLYGIVENKASTLVEWNLSDLQENKKTPLPFPQASIVHSQDDRILIHSLLLGLYKSDNITGPYKRIYPDANGDEALVSSVSLMPDNSLLLQTLDKGLVFLDAQGNTDSWKNLFPGTLPGRIQTGKGKVILHSNNHLFTQLKGQPSAPLYAGTGFGNRGIRYAFTNTYEYAIVDSLDKIYIQKLEGQSFKKCLQYTPSNIPFTVWNALSDQLAFTELNNTFQINSVNENCQLKSFSTLFSENVDFLSMNEHLVVTSGMEYSFPSGQPYLNLGVWDAKTQKYLFKGFPEGKSSQYFAYQEDQVFLHDQRLLLCDSKGCWNTLDAGTTWNPMTTSLPGRWIKFYLQDSLLFAFTEEQRFYLSADWGANWVQIDNYIPAHVNGFALSGTQAYWFTKDSLYTADATGLLQLVNDIKVSNRQVPEIAELQPYPNPVLAGQEIRLPGNTLIRSCRIFTLTGQLLQQLQNVDHWSIPTPGYYLLEWEDADGQRAISKIVVTNSMN